MQKTILSLALVVLTGSGAFAQSGSSSVPTTPDMNTRRR